MEGISSAKNIVVCRYGKLARVVWYCMACVTSCGMVCYGMAQCCKVWYGKRMLWYGMACVARYGTGYGMATGKGLQ